MKKLFTLFAIIFCLHTKAQTWVTIPDAHFVTYLHALVPAAMHGDSLDISNTLVTTTTHSISVYNKGITDLTGVQYFTSLTYLNCEDDPITSLPVLPNSLTYLNCSNTFLSSLPLLPSSLVYLNCQHNQISALPTLPNSINYLICSTNSLTTLPALPSSLDILVCSENLLTSLPVLPNSVVLLSCGANSLSILPALPNLLAYLDCGSNNLTTLPSLPNSLTILYCGLNSLSTLPALPNTLTFLDCEDNPLTSLPTLPNSLRELNCYRDSLTSLPVLPDSLAALDCRYNQIQCFPYIPKTIPPGELFINFNPFNCLPNYTKAMGPDTITYPLCAAGNTHGCNTTTGINKIAELAQLNIYPNPAQNNFTVEVSTNDKQTISIFDVNGKQVLSQTITGTTNIDANNFNAGVYNINIANSAGVANKRLVIVK